MGLQSTAWGTGSQILGWISNLLRSIFATIDWIVYNLIEGVLFVIFDVSSLTTSSDMLNDIYSRIYVLLGIFMVFKLSFSFFQYIVDPDSMAAKNEKGVSKLISRTIVMLIALVALPTLLFNNDSGGGLIQRAQKAFLPMLPRMILGINESSGTGVPSGNGNSEDISTAANVMAIGTLRGFFSPSPEIDSVCGEGTYDDTPQINSLAEFTENVNLSCKNTKPEGPPKYYKYSYLFIISTIVGLLLVVMLLGIAVDMAKRVFKMLILEVIAPIPIMSLIDPKSSKDGAFSHWVKSLISTFLDIFVKLGILYMVLMMIRIIFSHGVAGAPNQLFENYPVFGTGPQATQRYTYLSVILILGLIFFAKEAPKFIKDALGIKDSGAGLGTGMGMAAGAIGGLVGGHGLRGMATGALAGATADPKVGAYASGRDNAGKIRTGDKNFKGGLTNSLQKNAMRAQGIKAARKFNVTDETLDRQKKAMIESEAAASEFQMQYDEAVQNGTATKDMRDKLIASQSVAADAKRQYEKMDKMAGEFGIKRTPQDEMRHGRGIYKAMTSVGTATRNATRAVGHATYSAVDKVPYVGGAARSIESAVQQHRVNRIDRKETFNVGSEPIVNRDANGNIIDVSTGVDDRTRAATRRDNLDAQGTVQGAKRDWSSSHGRSGDGHIGKQ